MPRLIVFPTTFGRRIVTPMTETEDWIEPPELLGVRLVLSTSAAVGVLIAVAGIVTGNPLDMAFLAIIGLLLGASSRMRLDRPNTIRFAALAARLSSVVWLWLVLKIDAPGNVAVAWVWIAVAICLLSARTLLRFAFPEEYARPERVDATPPAGGSAQQAEGWIDEVPV